MQAHGTTGLRSERVLGNPAVGQQVSNTSALLQDIQALGNLHEQLARSGREAAQAARQGPSDPVVGMQGLLAALKESLCSYIFSYDEKLTPESTTPSAKVEQQVQTPAHNPGTWKMDLDDLAAPLVSPLTLPSFPGNLFYMATRDDMGEFNPSLNTAYLAAKTASPATPDSRLVSDLLPYHGVETTLLPTVLRQRWTNLLNLTAAGTVYLGQFQGSPVNMNLYPDADEVIAIAGFGSVPNYQLFLIIKQVSQILATIDPDTAIQLVEHVDGAGHGLPVARYSVSAWLAYGKLLLAPFPDLLSVIYERMAYRRSAQSMQGIWTWLTALATLNTTLLSIEQNGGHYILPTEAERDLASLSERFLLQSGNLDSLQVWFGTSWLALAKVFEGDTSVVLDPDDPDNRLSRLGWIGQARWVGGILGFEGVLLLAILTAFERCRSALLVPNSPTLQTDLKRYAAEGVKLSRYLTNPASVPDAFSALLEE